MTDRKNPAQKNSIERWYYNLRCHFCGRFVKPDADFSVPYGSYYDMEPSYPEYYCPLCIERLEQRYRGYGRPPQDWTKSHWGRKLAKELGYVEDSGGWWIKNGGDE